MYVDGRLVQAGQWQSIRCPADDAEFASVAWASAADADHALAAAERAFESWSSLPLDARADLAAQLRARIKANAVGLREAVMFETGKTWAQTGEDVQSLIDSLDFYPRAVAAMQSEEIGEPDPHHAHEVRHQPIGVVVAIIAWNFPLLNLGFKLGPAIAAGCPIVIKPSPKTPVSAYMIGELSAEIGFPAGAVNIVCGPDETVGTRLVESTIPGLITVIGSARAARSIVRASATSAKRYSMELGGNAPFIVFDDADLEAAVDVAAALKFGNAGQVCVAPNRIFVQRSIADAFTQAFVERASALRVGFGRDDELDMGPVIEAAALERMQAVVDDARNKGGRLLTGGAALDHLRPGHFFAPTVIGGMTPDMVMFKEEVFGPVAGIAIFDEEDAVIELANATETGLVAYVFTRDTSRIERCIAQLRFGEIQVNGVKYGIELPHGGIKQSGMGHDGSVLALRDYLAVKRVTRRTQAAQTAGKTEMESALS